MRAAREGSGDQPDRVAKRGRRPLAEAPRERLERDVVFARRRGAASGRRAGGLEVARVGRDVGPRGEPVAAAHAGVVAAAEELHRLGDDLDVLALVAVLVLPFAPLEATVDRHRTALGEEARAVLALGAPDRDVEEVGLVLPVTAGAAAARVAGDAQ